MKKRYSYEYAVLKYRHDAFTGECVNVGVLMTGRTQNFVGAKFNKTYGRVKNLFPDLDAHSYKTTISRIEISAKKLKKLDNSLSLPDLNGARQISNQILKQDDSSFFWSNVGSGLCRDYDSELEALYERFVQPTLDSEETRRSDNDIWRPVRERLSEHELVKCLQEVEIKSAVASVKFDHSWKNGQWHCYQPLSLDLATAEGIQNKAARWAGYLTGLASVHDEFKPYFLIGEPSDARLKESYRRAVELIRSSSGDAEFYNESESEMFAERIENQLSAHISTQRS